MAVIFDDNKGLTVQDGAVVREAIATDWKEAFKIDENTPELKTEPETPAGQLIDGMTALVVQKDSELMQLANMFNPVTATGIYQDALAKIYFINRHVAQPTVVTCQCKGLNGTVIPRGAVVQSNDGYQFTANENITIPAGGEVNALFSCTETGPILVSANSVQKIITVIPGWDSVNNSAAGVTGRNEETQSEFEERRYNSVAANSHGLAESVGGAVYNLVVPPHSVYLSVYGGESQDIGMTMHNKLDAGCGTAGNTSVTITDPTNGSLHLYYYTVPTVKPVYVQVTTAPDVLYNAADVQQAILDNFLGNVEGFNRVIMGDELYSSRFYQTIIDAGLNGLVKVEVSTDNSTFDLSVEFALNEMPTLSIDDITFVEVEDDG